MVDALTRSTCAPLPTTTTGSNKNTCLCQYKQNNLFLCYISQYDLESLTSWCGRMNLGSVCVLESHSAMEAVSLPAAERILTSSSVISAMLKRSAFSQLRFPVLQSFPCRRFNSVTPKSNFLHPALDHESKLQLGSLVFACIR